MYFLNSCHITAARQSKLYVGFRFKLTSLLQLVIIVTFVASLKIPYRQTEVKNQLKCDHIVYAGYVIHI